MKIKKGHSVSGGSSSSPRGVTRSTFSKMSKYKTTGTALTAINEGDEYCTLQEVLSQRGSWLSPEELWAVSRECCLTLRSISRSAEMVQGLCIMLETLAFDCHGHVCFTDHEREPDRHYLPPEYDKIGNSCKGHVYSLGMLIYEASAYNPTAIKIPELSTRLRKLLNNMMNSEYSERISLDGVIKECDLYFKSAGVGSSHDICKHIVSSINSRASDTELTDDNTDSSETDRKIGSAQPSNADQSSNMSLQQLVEKYTPDRLKAIVEKYAPSTNVHNASLPNKGSSGSDMKESTVGTSVSSDERKGSRSGESSILSPPDEFGVKYSVDERQHNNEPLKASRNSPDSEEDSDRVPPEGASLKKGSTPLQLPEAYSSSATHFSPIVLSSAGGIQTSTPSSRTKDGRKEQRTNKNLKELKKQLLKQHTSHDDKKSSPQQIISPPSEYKQPQPSQHISDFESGKPDRSSQGQPISSRPLNVQKKTRGAAPVPPVTQAVRPQPRNQETPQNSTNQESNNASYTYHTPPASVQSSLDYSPSLGSTNQSPSIHIAEIEQPIPAAVNTQATPALLVNNMLSPAIMPHYQSMPVVLQRDSATGTVSLLPVLPNWAISPQQAPAVIPPGQSLANASTAQPVSGFVSEQVAPSVTDTSNRDVSMGRDEQQPRVAASSATISSSTATAMLSDGQHLGGSADTNAVTANRTNDTSQQHVPGIQLQNVEAPSTEGVNGEPAHMSTAPNGKASRSSLASGEASTSGKSSSTTRLSVPGKKERKEKRAALTEKSSRAKDASKKPSHQKLLMLSEIRQLLKKEFAFDGYMEHGKEDVEMAEFIVSLHLPALDFSDWCNIIVAKYGDLYWGEELLVALYTAIHGQSPAIDRPPSGALRTKSARVLSVNEPGSNPPVQSVNSRVSASPFRPIPFSTSDLVVCTASSTPRKVKRNSLLKPKAMLPLGNHSEGGSMDALSSNSPLSVSLTRLKSASVTDLARQPSVSYSNLSKSKSQILLQTEPRDMTPLVKSLVLPSGGTRDVVYIEGKQANPLLDDMLSHGAASTTSAFEQESDSHSHSSASELRVKGRLHNYSRANSLGTNDMVDSAFGSRLSSEYESDNSLASHNKPDTPQLTICKTILYASYLADHRETVSLLADKSAHSVFISGYENKSVDGVKKKIADITQQISVNSKRRSKAAKYIKKFQTKGAGATEHKGVLPSVHAEYAEAVSQLDSLVHARLQLEVLLAEQFSIDVACLFSFTKPSRPLLVIDTKENPRLNFQKQTDPKTNMEKEVLYAGEPFGLLSYLYAVGSLEDGYILNFFHSYRYFLSAFDIMAFIAEKYNSAKELQPCATRTKVMSRSLDLLTFWVNCYYSVDFLFSPNVVVTLVNFLQDEVLQEDQAECGPLLKLIDDYENDKSKNSVFVNPLPSNDTLPYLEDDGGSQAKKGVLRRSNTFLRRTELDDWAEESKWNAAKTVLTAGSGKNSVQYLKTAEGISLLNGKSKKSGKELPLSKTHGIDGISIMDFSSSEIAEQLTLADQTCFADIHPVNFMNTLAQGISASMASGTADTIRQEEKKPLFYSDYVQFSALQAMIRHSKQVAHWVTAEVISCSSIKSQTALVHKFLQVAKICKELRNYATAMAIKDGLDHPLIRLIAAWKEVPSKLLQELDDLKMLLKTDSRAILAPETNQELPTIPCIFLFALHVQQLEQGGFTLANGMFRWPKLRSLAQLIDLIRLCKRYSYLFHDNAELGEFLKNRQTEMNTHNLESLTMSSGSEMSMARAGNSSRWSSIVKLVKGNFGNKN